MNRRASAFPIIAVLFIAAAAAFVVIQNPGIFDKLGLASIVGASADFAKPLWGRLECAPTDAYEGLLKKTLDQQTLFACNANTEECRFEIMNTEPKKAFADGSVGFYQECDLAGSSCGTSVHFDVAPQQKLQLPMIKSGRSYKFKTDFALNNIKDNTQITQDWRPWQLYRFVGGAKFIVNAADCSISSSQLDRIRQEDKVDKLYRTGAEGSKWINYVDDWAYGPGTGVVTYNGQQAYCSAATVYEIVKLQMANGKLVKLDSTYKGSTASGDPINGLGRQIAKVECCPGEATCGDDFKYKKAGDPTLADKQCFSDLQCFNAGGPAATGQRSYVTYSCQNSVCVKSSEKTVQCTTNAACASGMICDLSTTNYGQCITQKSGEFCGDGICQVTETSKICSADCDFTCPAGQTLVTQKSSEGALCFFGHGLCSDQEQKFCDDGSHSKSSFWSRAVYYVLFGMLFIAIFQAIRYGLKLIPIVGRLIP